MHNLVFCTFFHNFYFRFAHGIADSFGFRTDFFADGNFLYHASIFLYYRHFRTFGYFHGTFFKGLKIRFGSRAVNCVTLYIHALFAET